MKTIEKKYLIPFCLITSLFFLWGLANNMTDTLLSAFKRIMSMSDAQTSLIQFAFYGSYFCFCAACRAVYPQTQLQERRNSWTFALCLGRNIVFARSGSGFVCVLSDCFVHTCRRMLHLGNCRQSVHSFDGFARNCHPKTQYRTEFQPNRLHHGQFLYVADVSHHLRTRTRKRGQRRQKNRCFGIDYGNPRRSSDNTVARGNIRCGRHTYFIHSAFGLPCRSIVVCGVCRKTKKI